MQFVNKNNNELDQKLLDILQENIINLHSKKGPKYKKIEEEKEILILATRAANRKQKIDAIEYLENKKIETSYK